MRPRNVNRFRRYSAAPPSVILKAFGRRGLDMIGDRLGKWVIFKELGRGGMGRVYLAQEELTGRHAAIKVLAAELATDPGFLQRFQREVEILGKLDHPNIVKLHEAGCENNHHFYAMEYVEGESLDDILQTQGRLPWQEVLAIAAQLASALRHAHDHGIIHRDLKPPNILRTPQGLVKLTDFGIAKVFASRHLTAPGGVIGTAEYLSPEQAAGKVVGKRSDLYCLGAVLYAMLTGRPPFQGNSHLELMHKHRYAQFERPRRLVPEIPDEVDELIGRLLAKEPDDRPRDCQVFAKELDTVRRRLERKNHKTLIGEHEMPTVAENALAGIAAGSEPGPATLMSRLVRAELRRQIEGGPITRLLNRPWVIVLLLAACLGVIVWTFWPMSEQALFAHGEALMQTGEAMDMERAWREYFQPLQSRFPENPYQDQLRRYRQVLEASRAPQPSEAQRFYERGERLYRQGERRAAAQVWRDLVTAFEGEVQARPWIERAERGLNELEKAAADPERLKQVQPALDRAAALRREGKRAEAERIWAALEGLYRDDPSAADIIRAIEQARRSMP